MRNKLTIKVKLLLLILTTVFLVSIGVATISIYKINILSEHNIEDFKKNSYDKKELELKNYVDLAYKTINSYYDRSKKEKVKTEVQEDLKNNTNFLFSILEGNYKKLNGKVSEEELKKSLIEIINDTRYGDSGYFWVNDLDAKIVTHPIKPKLNGKDLSNFKDKGGKKIFSEFARVAKSDKEGFVDYVWPKPGFEKPQDKISYIKLFDKFNWVIGTGSYIDDVSSILQTEALKTISNMKFGQSGYFWINDSNHVVKMHRTKPSLAGKSLYNLQDPDGVYLYRNIVKTANGDIEGGIVKYKWAKPGLEEPQPKLSYVRNFKEWDMIIGTGAYVDDIEKEILLMQEKTEQEISDIIIFILVFTVVFIIIINFINTLLIKATVLNPLNELDKSIIQINDDKNEEIELIKKKNDDEIGKIVDSFNDYLTKLKDISNQDKIVINEVGQVIDKVKNGFYVYDAKSDTNNKNVKELKDGINNMISNTNTQLKEINSILLEYGKSNYDVNNMDFEHKPRNGIVGSIKNSTLLIGSSVSELLSMILNRGENLNKDIEVLSQSRNNLSQSRNKQAASLEETARAVEEITSITRNNTENVNKMSVLAEEVNISLKRGEDLRNQTTTSMEEINKEVSSINEAITIIDKIAFQTNILSLNARVERATRGERGKGFRVVRQEVRNLASRSREARKEIKDMVRSATEKANKGKKISNEMIQDYVILNTKISETITLITEVSTSSKEQETGIIQINDAINLLDQQTQTNAASRSQIDSLTNKVSKLGKDLTDIANRNNFNSTKREEICDIEMVFKVAKLKNDHIVFKDTNFAKVGDQTQKWTVKTCQECDLGKWMVEQERNNAVFTQGSNWKELQKYHYEVHQNVQDYIDINNPDTEFSKLQRISENLENATTEVFNKLDYVKKEHCLNKSKSEKNVETPIVNNVTSTNNRYENKSFNNKIDKPIDNKKFVSKTNEDDWESF